MQRLGALALQLVCSKSDICVNDRHHATQMLTCVPSQLQVFVHSMHMLRQASVV